MTTVLLSISTNTFCRDLDERIVGHLNLTFGSSRIASSASFFFCFYTYQEGIHIYIYTYIHIYIYIFAGKHFLFLQNTHKPRVPSPFVGLGGSVFFFFFFAVLILLADFRQGLVRTLSLIYIYIYKTHTFPHVTTKFYIKFRIGIVLQCLCWTLFFYLIGDPPNQVVSPLIDLYTYKRWFLRHEFTEQKNNYFFFFFHYLKLKNQLYQSTRQSKPLFLLPFIGKQKILNSLFSLRLQWNSKKFAFVTHKC